MIESLFIYYRGVRTEVDMQNPSGITLRFNSSLFNDITKISNSYTYTFSLPKTRKNMQIFECVDDMRSKTSIFTKRLPCSYSVDGLELIRDAYLYVSEVDDKYNCCIVWGVIEGLANIQDNNISINELDEYTDYTKSVKRTQFYGENSRSLVLYGDMATFTGNYPDTITPYYGMGVPYGKPIERYGYIYVPLREADYDKETLSVNNYLRTCPNPAIRIDALMKRINEYFHTDIRLTTNGGTDTYSIMQGNVFSHGIIPLVKNETSKILNESQAVTMRTPSLQYIHNTRKESYGGWSVIAFENVFMPYHDVNNTIEMYKSSGMNVSKIYDGDTYNLYNYGFALRLGASASIDGKVTLTYNEHEYQQMRESGDTPKLCVWRMIRKYRFDDVLNVPTFYLEKDGDDYEVASIDGVFDFENSVYDTSRHLENPLRGDNKYIFHFDFTQAEGFDRLDCGLMNKGSNAREGDGRGGNHLRDYYVYVIVVNGNVSTISENIRVIPRFENGNIYDYGTRNSVIIHNIDLYPNLPDITCMDFIKALFYMGGGFPVCQGGVITIKSYRDILQNKVKGNVYDWSDYVVSDEPKQTFTMNDFAQKNYYLMKNQTEDEDEKEYNDDVYSDDKFVIEINNAMLDKKKTVITLPFYGKYLMQGTNHNIETGNGMKLWKYENGVYSACEGQPSIMTLEVRQGNYLSPYLSAKVWGWDDMPSMDYARSILANARIVSIEVRLRIIDLLNLDYTKPVYIRKFNSYFAISNIEWTTNNDTFTLNAIKLPN